MLKQNPEKNKSGLHRAEPRSLQSGSGNFLSALLVGEESPDYAAFLSLVKEAGRHLNSFAPPDGFTPDGPAPEMALSSEAAKALGAGSLRDFFSLALEGEEARAVKEREGRLPAFFPQGPESVQPALSFIESKCSSLSKAVFELKKNWPKNEPGLEAALRPLENTLEALTENRLGLIRVERDLWPRMKEEALEWPRDAKRLWEKAQSLKQSVSPLLKATKAELSENEAPGLMDRGRRSLTRAIMELKTLVGQGRELIESESAWNRSHQSLLTDLDDCMAVAVDGGQPDRDWKADNRWLSGCLSALEKEDRRLRDEAAQTAEALQLALESLVEIETRLSGHQSTEMLEGLESVGRGVQALWRSTIERRRQMARIYFTIPARLGRPLFLEKALMAAAQALGRSQSLLEDLRHQLSLAGSKISTTHRLRGEGRQLAERLAHHKNRASKLKIARKRLNVLAGVVEQRLSLAATRGELETAVAKGEESEKRLSRGRVENTRMYRELKAAAMERERLTDQLTAAHQKLGEAGLVKARLLKVFAHKSAIWDDIERSRQKLLAENEALKAEKAELKLKRGRLAELYSQERQELKKLTAELKDSRGELTRTKEYVELRHDLEKRLDETRREKEALTARSREVEAQLQERSTQLAAAVAQADSLSLELARHREELAAASKARLSLGEKAAALRRRQDVLAQAHASLQKALKRKSGQLLRTEAERDGLTIKVNRQKRNIIRLVATRQQLRAELGAARLTIFDLEKDRDKLFERLSQAQSEISRSDQEKGELNSLVKALADEKSFLLKQMETVQREKEELSLRLDKLGEENSRLVAAEEEKGDLQTRLAGLEDENSRLTQLVGDLEQRNEELGRQLSDLESKVSEDLFPFIKIMGEALWRSEAQLKRARAASARLLDRFELEFEAKEANLRLQAAGRELELNSQARNEKADLEKQLEEFRAGAEAEKAQLEKRLEEIQAGAEAEKADLEKQLQEFQAGSEAEKARLEKRLEEIRSESVTEKRELERRFEDYQFRAEAEKKEMEARLAGLKSDQQSLMEERDRLGGRNTKLRQALGVMKNRHSARLDQSRSDLQSKLAGQEKELKLQKAKLAQLEPLVSYFIASAESDGTAGGLNIEPELLAYLKEAGQALGEELSAEEGLEAGAMDSDSLAIEGGKASDLALAARLKARLNEIQPLVAFLARSFVGSVAELAQVRQERATLSEELARTKRDNELFSSELAQLRTDDEQLRSEVERLRQDSSILSGRVDLAGSTREMLEDKISLRESELREVQGQASALALEKARLEGLIGEQRKEIGLLKSELAQADRDLTENDGRLESAWAALNYLAAKAGDSLGSMKSKLESQVRQIDQLGLELKKREAIIGGLEDRQNQLALLFWTLVDRASQAEPGQLAAPAARALGGPGQPAFAEISADDFDLEILELEGPALSESSAGPFIPDAAVIGQRQPGFVAVGSHHSGGYSLGRGILEGVKKVARRSLLTLLLAGGLVMSAPLSAESTASVYPQADLIVASAAEADPQLRSRLDSTYIGRTVSLEMVEADLRLAGRPAVENRLAEMVSELAAGHGLTNGEFLRLLRTARGAEDTIHLDEFKDRQGALTLLSFHLPKLSRQMTLWPSDVLNLEKLSALMKSASDFKLAEGGFWERMYFDLVAAGRSNDQALNDLLEAMNQKNLMTQSLRPEYAGRLAPFPQLENLGPDRFIGFMADYINENWSNLSGRGRHQAARRLAGDIYFAARIFKLPTTLLSSLLHEEAEADQADFFRRGSTCAIHARAADLADLTRNFSLVWQEGSPPLCDLDEALAASEKESFVEGVYRRKMALVMSYNKAMSSGSSLFDELQ